MKIIYENTGRAGKKMGGARGAEGRLLTCKRGVAWGAKGLQYSTLTYTPKKMGMMEEEGVRCMAVVLSQSEHIPRAKNSTLVGSFFLSQKVHEN